MTRNRVLFGLIICSSPLSNNFRGFLSWKTDVYQLYMQEIELQSHNNYLRAKVLSQFSLSLPLLKQLWAVEKWRKKAEIRLVGLTWMLLIDYADKWTWEDTAATGAAATPNELDADRNWMRVRSCFAVDLWSELSPCKPHEHQSPLLSSRPDSFSTCVRFLLQSRHWTYKL